MTQLTLPLQNRNASYHALELGHRQEQVLNVIKAHCGISNRQIAELLHLPINSVTGRVKELRERGLVTIYNSEIDMVTLRTVTLWRAVWAALKI